jgi:hypothetical protein
MVSSRWCSDGCFAVGCFEPETRRIPWLLWCGLLFGAVVFIALMGSMRLKSRRRHVLLSSAVAVLLGLLLYIVFCLDHPLGAN